MSYFRLTVAAFLSTREVVTKDELRAELLDKIGPMRPLVRSEENQAARRAHGKKVSSRGNRMSVVLHRELKTLAALGWVKFDYCPTCHTTPVIKVLDHEQLKILAAIWRREFDGTNSKDKRRKKAVWES